MPISQRALEGLAAAVRWNPNGARALLAILREHSGWVKHKDDKYGPLGVVLFGVTRRKEVAPGVTVPTGAPPMSEQSLAACEALGKEWKEGSFSVLELANALDDILQSDSRAAATHG